jgi:hypothetical protein
MWYDLLLVLFQLIPKYYRFDQTSTGWPFKSKFSYEFRITAIEVSIQSNSQIMLDHAFFLSYFKVNNIFENELFKSKRRHLKESIIVYLIVSRVIIAPNYLPGGRAF